MKKFFFLFRFAVLALSAAIIAGCCKDLPQRVFQQGTFGRASDVEIATSIIPIGGNQFMIAGSLRDANVLTVLVSGGTPPVFNRQQVFIPATGAPSVGPTMGKALLRNADGQLITAANAGLNLPVLAVTDGENNNLDLKGLNSAGLTMLLLNDVVQLKDKSYLVTGCAVKPEDNRAQDVMLIRISSDLTRIFWARTYGGPGYDCGEKIIETPDGNVWVFGVTNSTPTASEDIFALRADLSTGNLTDTRLFGTRHSDDTPRPVLTGNDIYLAFNVRETGNFDMAVCKMDVNLSNLTWIKRFGTPGTDFLRGSCAAVGGNGIVLTGASGADPTLSLATDVIWCRIDGSGNLTGVTAYGGCGVDAGESVCPFGGEGYMIAGTTESFSGNSDIYIIKTDLSGRSLINDLNVPAFTSQQLNFQRAEPVFSPSFISVSIGTINATVDRTPLTGATQPTDRKGCN